MSAVLILSTHFFALPVVSVAPPPDYEVLKYLLRYETMLEEFTRMPLSEVTDQSPEELSRAVNVANALKMDVLEVILAHFGSDLAWWKIVEDEASDWEKIEQEAANYTEYIAHRFTFFADIVQSVAVVTHSRTDELAREIQKRREEIITHAGNEYVTTFMKAEPARAHVYFSQYQSNLQDLLNSYDTEAEEKLVMFTHADKLLTELLQTTRRLSGS